MSRARIQGIHSQLWDGRPLKVVRFCPSRTGAKPHITPKGAICRLQLPTVFYDPTTQGAIVVKVKDGRQA